MGLLDGGCLYIGGGGCCGFVGIKRGGWGLVLLRIRSRSSVIVYVVRRRYHLVARGAGGGYGLRFRLFLLYAGPHNSLLSATFDDTCHQ